VINTKTPARKAKERDGQTQMGKERLRQHATTRHVVWTKQIVITTIAFRDSKLMPQSKMAYDPLRRIFPQFLAMIVQFYGAGKAAAAIIAATAEIVGIAGLGMGR
jgi:hypothetical protein